MAQGRGDMPPSFAISFQDAETVDVDLHASLLSRSVVPVIMRRDGVHAYSVGTAFCLATLQSGEVIFATAKHVIDQLADVAPIEGFVLLPEGLATERERNSLVGVNIQLISLADAYSDVALIVANIRDSELTVTTELKWLPLTFGQPQIGQRCMALGYPQKTSASFTYTLLATQGIIEEIHPQRRDGALSTFPSFRTTALFRGGMSGGPIIGENGRVIGVISHGTESDRPELVTGYGASIAAIAELKLDLHDNDGKVQEFSVNQLTEMGILARGDRSTVTLHRADTGVTLTWHSPDSG
jgi:S1-C subfamily serine protease